MLKTAKSWITRRPHLDGIEACIRDSNIHVWGLVEYKNMGLSDQEIALRVQGVTQADLDEAWEYYHNHQQEIDEAIRRNGDE